MIDVDVGNSSPQKAESYIKNLMEAHKKFMDGSNLKDWPIMWLTNRHGANNTIVGTVNVKKDNGEIRVGFCDDCEHPLWNPEETQ